MSLLANQTRQPAPSALPVALTALAVVVVCCKYISPILYYIAEHIAHRPLADVPVLWDFWWPFYLICAGSVYSRSRYGRSMFLTLAGARILFAIVALTLFFSRGEWNFWSLQWLFCEIAALAVMGSGAFLALSYTGRDRLAVRAQPVSLAS